MTMRNILIAAVLLVIAIFLFLHFPFSAYDRGMKYYAKGDLDNAIKEFKSIPIENTKDRPRAMNMLGLIYTDKHEYSMAISEFTAILLVDPTSTQIHNNLGYAYALSGDSADAFTEFSETLRLDPCNPFATINYKYPLTPSGIRPNLPISLFFGSHDEVPERLIKELDRPLHSTNEAGAEIPSHDYRDYAVWALGSLKYKNAEEPLLQLAMKNDLGPCGGRLIDWSLKQIRDR
jgi:tetratricopeptide (TPR) repeat protein